MPSTFDDNDRVSNIFSTEMLVPETDIDALGHASNIAYVRWVQEVAVAHSEQVGWDREAYRTAGIVFVVRRHEVDYLRPVLINERIRLRTWIASFTAATSSRRTEVISVSASGAEQLVARAQTTWALIATDTGRPCRITPELEQAFQRHDAA